MVHKSADCGVIKALAELESEGIIEFSCSGVPIGNDDGTFAESKLAHDFNVEMEKHLADTSAALGVFYGKELRVGSPSVRTSEAVMLIQPTASPLRFTAT